MPEKVISVERLSKTYRLGVISHKTLTHDLQSWWARARGKENPNARISPYGFIDSGSNEEILALNSVSFDVIRGEVLGIIGRNGAGKSTLLKILSRVTAPTLGEVKIKGRVASLLEVGTGFHPELTGRENIYLNGSILGMTKSEITSKFDEIVEFAGIDRYIDTPVKRYSSGMYVRLAFAVAAHLEPEILVVDEVLAVGDAEFQKKCLGKMSAVAHDGRTVLFVSHNMAMVRKLCSQSLLLEKGTVALTADTESVINHYLTEHAVNSNSIVELPKQSDGSTGSGRGLRLLITDEVGNFRNSFKIGEMWIIRLEFEITKSMNHVIAAIGLVTRESIPLVTFWSHPSDLRVGIYFAEFKCNLSLSSTQLSIVVGLSEHEHSFYYLQEAGIVEIVPLSVGEQPFRSSGSGLLLGSQESTIHPIN